MRRLAAWSLPLGLAAAITWLSHQPQYPLGLTLPYGLDKVAHALAFGSLAFLLDRALRTGHQDLPLYRRHLWVFLGVSIFGALDEWHQGYIPGREASLLDWVADSLGAALGLFATVVPALHTRRLEALSWCRGSARRPDPARPLVLVADPHWASELVGLEAATLAHPEADWLFLGDVFDVWVGLPDMQTEPQHRFLQWVGERRAAGRWVGLWLGNREYFLDRHASRFDLMGEGTGGRLEGEELRFEHGDLINSADWKYRAWNLVSRSALFWAAFSLLPGALAASVAANLERRLRTTNRAYKLAFPRGAFEAAASTEAPATFLTGHFHTLERAANGLALPWAFEGQFMVWQGGRVEPLGAKPDAP